MRRSRTEIEDLTTGDNCHANPGQHVVVHYTGWLENGEIRLQPRPQFTVPLSSRRRRSDPGWDEGVAGMQVGGKRKLTIPPHMGYGPQRRRRDSAECDADFRSGTAQGDLSFIAAAQIRP